MTSPQPYPFSDLTRAQVQELMRTARREQNLAIQRLLSDLWRSLRTGSFWPKRQREAQTWPAKHVHSASFTVL